MVKNVGSSDRQLRTGVGAIAGIVSLAILTDVLSAPAVLSPVIGVVALIMLVTAATGTCGLYSLLGVNTCSLESGPTR